MSSWDAYFDRIGLVGDMREMRVGRTGESIRRRIQNSPSYRKVQVDGMEQGVAITHRQNLSEKNIFSLPGEHLKHGGIVLFSGHKWLITELDGDSGVYEKGIMLQCNHRLRWIGKDGTLKEKWCVVEDGTKYLIGEFSEDMMSIGDARIALTIAKDADTTELRRGMRFLIDDEDSDTVLAYQITKSNRLFNVYEGEGVFKFILNEVPLTDADNKELRIADYTSWTPPKETDGDHQDSDYSVDEVVQNANNYASAPPPDDKEEWI